MDNKTTSLPTTAAQGDKINYLTDSKHFPHTIMSRGLYHLIKTFENTV